MAVITRIYDRPDAARAVVAELKAAGLADQDVSVVADGAEGRPADIGGGDEAPARDGSATTGSGATVGATLGGGAGILAGLGLIAIPGAGPVVAAGWLATAAAGAVTGAVAGAATGGFVEALADSGVERADADAYGEAVRRGAILVSARVEAADEARVRAVMDRHDPADLALRRAQWERDGWSTPTPAGDPLSPDERRG